MKSFKEFLQDQAVQIRAESAGKAAKREEWISAVARLIGLMKSWIIENDTEHLVRLEERSVECSEESIGIDSIVGLRIELGSRVVEVEPVAYQVLGPRLRPKEGAWRGRVELVGGPLRSKLYRFVGLDQVEEWWIYDEDDRHIRPFNRERFESALVSLLS